MACHLLGAMPFSEPILAWCQLHPECWIKMHQFPYRKGDLKMFSSKFHPCVNLDSWHQWIQSISINYAFHVNDVFLWQKSIEICGCVWNTQNETKSNITVNSRYEIQMVFLINIVNSSQWLLCLLWKEFTLNHQHLEWAALDYLDIQGQFKCKRPHFSVLRFLL